jgi:alanine racemase
MRPTRAVVDLGAIARNYRRIAERLGGDRAVFCVVKGNAYGHGAAAGA